MLIFIKFLWNRLTKPKSVKEQRYQYWSYFHKKFRAEFTEEFGLKYHRFSFDQDTPPPQTPLLTKKELSDIFSSARQLSRRTIAEVKRREDKGWTLYSDWDGEKDQPVLKPGQG